MIKSIFVCAALMALTVEGIASVKIEKLGQPCRAKNVLAGRVVTDRSSGKDMLVITNMNETSGAELIFIDPEKDTGKLFHAPDGSGSWALNEVPGDRMVIGTFYDGRFMVFDLKKMEFIKSVEFPGESYIWNLAMGKDGRIYGGTYSGAKLGALDLNTYAVEDCGAPAPPNLYLRYVNSLPDGRIFCSFWTEKPLQMIYDPATKKFEPAPKDLEGVDQGVSWNDYFLVGNKAFDGKTLDRVDPLPYPEPPKDKGDWYVDVRLTTNDTLYLRQGTDIYRYKKGDKDITLAAEPGPRIGGVFGVTKKGEFLGVRGQDYVMVKPGEKAPVIRPIPVESGPRPTLFLRLDSKGRLWGGPHFGQTLFHLDTHTKKYVNTGIICDAGGEVYDVAFHNGKVYAASYSGGDIVCYDPEAKWDQWNHKNPKVIASMGSKGYIRPEAGITTGPDGKLYSGWWAKYGTYGGAVAITDPDTGETELIENPLGEMAVSGVATDGRYIYVGSSVAANGLPHKKEATKFGVIDLSTKKVIKDRTFDDVLTVRVLGYDAKTKKVVVGTGKPRLFDTVKQEFDADLPSDTPAITCISVSVPGDGKAYYGNDKSIVALDLTSGKSAKLADMPGKVSNVAVGPDGTIYASCDSDVYVVQVKE